MPKSEKLEESATPPLTLALDTIKKNKQALMFLSTKRSAEKAAEDLAKKLKATNPIYNEMAERALNTLSKPTKQCNRLAYCLRKGMAFHHAGLAQKQKDLIEEHFKRGDIKVICCTPTLAYGVDMPAYRAIIRDTKRFGKHGMQYIPVLDFLQMAGRAGRPSFDNEGQAILLASSQSEKEELRERYIEGEPEEIYSKLAVEPVMRTYLLSLIASRFTNNHEEIMEFFSKTFYAHQFEDLERLEQIIDKMLHLLEEWEFIISSGGQDDFVSADEIEEKKVRATALGKRVAELYIDPLTAHIFITCMREASSRPLHAMSLLHMIANTQEMRPLLRVRTKEYDKIQEELVVYDQYLLEKEPSLYDPEYEEFLNSFKTALMFHGWVEEKSEDDLLEEFQVRPGELKVKLDTADWLLYASEEMAKILQFRNVHREVIKTRYRMRYGVKEELMPLLKLDGIGRVRARKLHYNRLRDLGDLRKANLTTLKQILGEKTAINVKKQLGEDVKEVPKGTRKGQLSLGKYADD